jgi:hypothetical protein
MSRTRRPPRLEVPVRLGEQRRDVSVVPIPGEEQRGGSDPHVRVVTHPSRVPFSERMLPVAIRTVESMSIAAGLSRPLLLRPRVSGEQALGAEVRTARALALDSVGAAVVGEPVDLAGDVVQEVDGPEPRQEVTCKQDLPATCQLARTPRRAEISSARSDLSVNLPHPSSERWHRGRSFVTGHGRRSSHLSTENGHG